MNPTMPRRSPPASIALRSLFHLAWVGVLVAAGAACGNIGLSAAEASLPSSGGFGHEADASSDAGAATPPLGGADALGPGAADSAAASASVGNPLCFFGYSDGGVHFCQPDTSSQCAQPAEEDAGTFTGWEDASPGTAGGGDAGGVRSACHVEPLPTGQACLTAGSGGDGAQCQKSTDCADSFECVGSPGQCRHYCCGGNASCDQASNETTGTTFCDVQPAVPSGLNVPVCEPVRSCTLLLTGTGNGSCPQGETCAVVKDDGTTSCVTIGTVGIGGDCDVYHCAADLTCLGAAGSRTCFQLCEVDSPGACPTGTTCTSSAQLFTNANVGICQ
jgi:hypothetical protein